MDFSTFIAISNLLQLFTNSNQNSIEILSYEDLVSVGKVVPTYKILQNFTDIFINNDIVYENLNLGSKIPHILAYKSNTTLNYNNLIRNLSKLSIDKLFLLLRHFLCLFDNKIEFPFILTFSNFTTILKDPFYKNISYSLDISFKDFGIVAKAASQEFNKTDYIKFIFNTLDINNNTFIEVYELMMLSKINSIYNCLKSGKKYDEKIMKLTKETGHLDPALFLHDYNDRNILLVDKNDITYMNYVNFLLILDKLQIYIYADKLPPISVFIFKQK